MRRLVLKFKETHIMSTDETGKPFGSGYLFHLGMSCTKKSVMLWKHSSIGENASRGFKMNHTYKQLIIE